MRDQIDSSRAPHAVDRHVGLRIRMRRKELGVTQEKLAHMLGLTFQQVQKYERASNRVSASKLWEVSRALDAPVAYFYDGLEATAPGGASSPHSEASAFLLTAEGHELAGLFPQIPERRARRKVLELIRVMADED